MIRIDLEEIHSGNNARTLTLVVQSLRGRNEPLLQPKRKRRIRLVHEVVSGVTDVKNLDIYRITVQLNLLQPSHQDRGPAICLTPLNTEPHFTEYYIEGFIGGKQAKMLVDTGCTRTLVHRKFVSKSDETANKITVLTATGERIVIPLAWVEIKVQQGTYKELVGVIENLPVDCLLGRSSYGRVITR